MAEKNYAKIQMYFNQKMASLFGYQRIAILFKHVQGPNLFSIISDNLDELSLTQDYSDNNIISYPMNMGVTGKSISLKTVVVA